MGEFIIPFLPPSVNHAYINRIMGKRVMRFLSKEAKIFKEQVSLIARREKAELITKGKHVSLRLDFTVPDHRRRDIDNLLKMTFDSLSGVAFADDTQVTSLYVTKTVKKGEEGVLVWYEETSLS